MFGLSNMIAERISRHVAVCDFTYNSFELNTFGPKASLCVSISRYSWKILILVEIRVNAIVSVYDSVFCMMDERN